MLLIGHRGCRYQGFNQNTIRAFEKVTTEGVPAIEFDVQLSSDDQLVVLHNLDLNEVSTGKGKVSETHSKVLKSLFAGDPKQGKDRIPFLPEVFDFFASFSPAKRPAIHMELKGQNTGKRAGGLFMEYVAQGKLETSDLLASSFNWHELDALRKICPAARIALLDGAIQRRLLLEKTGPFVEKYFTKIFAYGNEEYMLPRFATLPENLEILKKQYNDEPDVLAILAEEVKCCIEGGYYTDILLDAACSMNASSINLWYRPLSSEFIEKAHKRGLAVYAYTVNLPADVLSLKEMGVDGIFTDYFADTARLLDQLPFPS